MPDLRDMQLLMALAHHRHFARAAKDCGISQPAFSARIRNLEKVMGVPIVQRGNRFQGFTPEGETMLKWARRVLADMDEMRQELQVAKHRLSGTLAVGVVPTALAFVDRVPALLRARHPGLAIRIFALSTGQIHRGLEDYSLDAGVGYLEGEMPRALAPAQLLYEETFVLLAPAEIAPRSSGPATWAEAAALPLCVLTQDMRNRQFLDRVFEDQVGARPVPVLETNDLLGMLAQVDSGASATVAPAYLADRVALSENVVRLPLIEGDVRTPIGLLTLVRDPVPAKLKALTDALRMPLLKMPTQLSVSPSE
ncbi:MAG: LysR family transcriptional regulator [Pseudomonadota bacterium]